ncbi:unnamed protein product [Adineta ricciae]|uniref:G-protein coupled receptors family 1 profile domain-containing protein n=1 Tax=Adineta ricciae TaxID=249248 RepID=A0A814NCW0_ADIRI|nr:unnamed protein product [Adineta ricciae]CAF1091409.1 unnamed protein product [Adineta ricciae]
MTNISIIAEQIYSFSQEYAFYGSMIIMIGGLLSNICLMLTLTGVRIFRQNQCAFYLTSECFANIGILSIILTSRMLTRIGKVDPVNLSEVWCKIRSWLINVFCVTSLGTVCSAACDQYLSTNHRYSLRQRSTLILAHQLVFTVVLFATIHSIPLLVYSSIDPTAGCQISNRILIRYYTVFYYPFVTTSFPIIVVSSSSFLAYRNVRRLVRRHIPVIRRRLDRQLTAMVLTRSICLIALGLPYIVYSLYALNSTIRKDDELSLAISQLFEVVTLSLFYTNYSINFYVFLFISAQFRRQVKYYFFKRWFRLATQVPHRCRNKIAPQVIAVIDLD